MVKENATTVTLTGSEVTVEFDKNYTYFWVNNIGDSAVYASMKPDVTADKDGVITVLSGTAAGTMHGYGADMICLNGSGKVQIIGTYSAFCPFRVGAKGGDGGGTSEFSAAGSATQPVYFDADGRPVAISHTIEADVPENAVFTDTKYDDTSISNRVAEVEENLGEHTVKTNVPSGAVFTDTTYTISNSYTIIKLTDNKNKTSQIQAACCKSVTVAASETVTLYSTSNHPVSAALKLLVAFDDTTGGCQCAWYSMGVKSIEGFTNTAFTETISQSGRTLTFTNPATNHDYTVHVFYFM